MDSDTISEIDVHASIEISLNLLRNQYKERVEIHREYGSIPKIRGYSGKLGQVFMNLLSNAFHAIASKGDVWIRTRADDGFVQVDVEDNGQGFDLAHASPDRNGLTNMAQRMSEVAGTCQVFLHDQNSGAGNRTRVEHQLRHY